MKYDRKKEIKIKIINFFLYFKSLFDFNDMKSKLTVMESEPESQKIDRVGNSYFEKNLWIKSVVEKEKKEGLKK